jgi:hypothetical protein
MNFRPEMAVKVLTGEKTVTRRLPSRNRRSPWYRRRCALVVGRDYAVCPGRGRESVGRVEIVRARMTPLGWLRDDEARREGFESGRAFADYWRKLHGSYVDRQLVWRVEFELVPCCLVMLGEGTDTYDPICQLPMGHRGSCMSSSAITQHRLVDREAWARGVVGL